MMFFGIHQPVEQAPEWIGLIFAAGIAAHLLTHWRGFKGYFSQPLALGIVGALVLAAAVLMLPGGESGRGGGMKGLIHRVETVPLAQVAPLFNAEPDRIVTAVRAAGLSVVDAKQSIAAIAAANDTARGAVLRLLLD